MLLLLVVLHSCAKKERSEKEPNNFFAEANEIDQDERILGYMDGPTDRDYYVLRMEESRIIDLRVSGVRGINLAVKIWKGAREPKLIKWVDDNRKSSPERFVNLSAAPGTYFIEILQSDRDPKKENRESPYELSLKSREAIAEESEPNDTMDEANPIEPGREVTGFFSPAFNWMNTDKEHPNREEDWFVINVNLPTDSPVLMDVSLTGVSGVDSILSLYDEKGGKIAESDNGAVGEPEMLSGVGIKKSGKYYIMVASKNYASNNDEPYSLTATIKERDPGVEMEPNDDFENANTIVNNLITGKINSRDDRDMFRYQASGPGIYRIELRPPEDMDALFTIYSSDKEKIIDVNNAGAGGREVFPNFYSERDFYIEVSAKTTGELPKGDYVLSVTPFKDIENQEREPNNDISQANEIRGRATTGYISSRRDKDYFLITSNMRIREKFEVQGVKGGRIRVSITDPMGFIIKSYSVRGDRSVIFSEMIDKKAYIIVESVAENYDNPYTIILRGAQ
jgi:hypothetical protein